mgnify:CR=1 FL=1
MKLKHFLLLSNFSVLYFVQKNAKGEVLYQALFKHLELLEKDFFGLEFLAESPDRMVSDESCFL